MIKVYLDWNVTAQMKGGYQNDLFKALSNKDKFFIPYFTSHIGDILSSYSEDIEQKKRIAKDLEFITSLTDNLCLSNNGKQVILLSKFSPTNGHITHFMEIKILVKMLNEYFGNDIENKGNFLDKEFEEENWTGRIWKLDDIQFKLLALNSYFQLYFDF